MQRATVRSLSDLYIYVPLTLYRLAVKGLISFECKIFLLLMFFDATAFHKNVNIIHGVE